MAKRKDEDERKDEKDERKDKEDFDDDEDVEEADADEDEEGDEDEDDDSDGDGDEDDDESDDDDDESDDDEDEDDKSSPAPPKGKTKMAKGVREDVQEVTEVDPEELLQAIQDGAYEGAKNGIVKSLNYKRLAEAICENLDLDGLAKAVAVKVSGRITKSFEEKLDGISKSVTEAKEETVLVKGLITEKAQAAPAGSGKPASGKVDPINKGTLSETVTGEGDELGEDDYAQIDVLFSKLEKAAEGNPDAAAAMSQFALIVDDPDRMNKGIITQLRNTVERFAA